MASLNLHTDHLAPEEQPKAEAELRWMIQAVRRNRPFLPWVVAGAAVIGAFFAGVLWERGEHLAVEIGSGVVAVVLALLLILVRIRRRAGFEQRWEMAALHWHAARNLMKEAIRKHDAREAAEQVKEESRRRAEIMELLRRR